MAQSRSAQRGLLVLMGVAVVVVHHTLSRLYIHQFPVLAPGETAIYDNREGDDPLGFFFKTWAQGQLSP
jgi:hypothetical protein